MAKARSGLQRGRMGLTALLVGCSLLGPAAPAKASAWTSPVTLTDGEGGGKIVFDRDGNALAVWLRHGRLDAAFRPAGGNFGPIQTLSPQDQEPFPSGVAFDHRGNASVVWAAFSPDLGGQIWSAFRPTGGSFGPPSLLSGPGWRGPPERVVFDRGGNAIAIGLRHVDGPYSHIGEIQTAFRAAGTRFFGAPQTLASEAGESPPTVAFDRKGNALALWVGDPFVQGETVQAAFRPAGGAFGADETIANTLGSYFPKLAFDRHGNAIAAWVQRVGPDNRDRVEAAFRPAGGSFGLPATLSGGGRENIDGPSLAEDAKGNAIAVWATYNYEPPKLQVAFRPAGGSFGPPETIADDQGGFEDPKLAMNQRGDAVLVWTNFLYPGPGYSIEANVRPAGGTFSAPEVLSTGGSRRGTDAAIDSKGNAAALWILDGRVEAAFSSSH